MEMERVFEFPHTHLDRQPRKRPRLGWDVTEPPKLEKPVLRESLHYDLICFHFYVQYHLHFQKEYVVQYQMELQAI
ncbi:hypothetical protein QN277_011152 [Acacia crassicarpa]|uniref:Uncharacterized protein n=1 Tax=Acacia crassicarpa TaxID=499986 RepID=A0AAE1MY10_9FABA|nr:hypothetical protein QN277_011152 [Acacia crassicarpa]